MVKIGKNMLFSILEKVIVKLFSLAPKDASHFDERGIRFQLWHWNISLSPIGCDRRQSCYISHT